jgi:hypothetical protein
MRALQNRDVFAVDCHVGQGKMSIGILLLSQPQEHIALVDVDNKANSYRVDLGGMEVGMYRDIEVELING